MSAAITHPQEPFEPPLAPFVPRVRNPHAALDFTRADGDEIVAALDTYQAALVDVLKLFAALSDANAPDAVVVARRARDAVLRVRSGR